MNRVITPDTDQTRDLSRPHIFLAGSINQGESAEWQKFVINKLSAESDLVLVNPRRDVWDPTLTQDISNPEFSRQVNFEMENIERADAVIMWLEPGSLSPISLLELGFLAAETRKGSLNKLIVGCPNGFWRRGNVQVMVQRYKLELVETLDDLIFYGLLLARRNHERRMHFENSRFGVTGLF